MGSLLAHFQAAGVTFEPLPNGKLRAHGPLTEELCGAIRANKPAIIAELEAANDRRVGSVPPTAEADNAPHYRWLILEADGRRREVCTLPEMRAAELAACYPGARFMPLPDSAAEAGMSLGQREAA